MQPVLTQSYTADSATDFAQDHAREEAVAQPKIAKRPTQWKKAVPNKEHAATSQPSPSRHTIEAWQDDARFGIGLVITVIALNALLALLSSGEHKTTSSSLMIQQIGHRSVLPTPTNEQTTAIRSFATEPAPEEEEANRIRGFVEEHQRLLKEMETTAPRSIKVNHDHES